MERSPSSCINSLLAEVHDLSQAVEAELRASTPIWSSLLLSVKHLESNRYNKDLEWRTPLWFMKRIHSTNNHGYFTVENPILSGRPLTETGTSAYDTIPSQMELLETIVQNSNEICCAQSSATIAFDAKVEASKAVCGALALNGKVIVRNLKNIENASARPRAPLRKTNKLCDEVENGRKKTRRLQGSDTESNDSEKEI